MTCSGEYKVMGLAPYGEPKYVKRIYDHMIELHDDGSLWLNQDYFNLLLWLDGDERTLPRAVRRAAGHRGRGR